MAKQELASRGARRQRRSSDEIRGQLLAAAGAEFRARGYGGATTAAIARRAGVAEVQLFRAFPRKADLFREAILAPLAEHVRRFREESIDGEGEGLAMGLAYLARLRGFLGEQAPLLNSLFDAETYSAADVEEKAVIRSGVQQFFDACAEAMAERLGGGRDTALLARILHGTLLGCLTYDAWLFPEDADRGAVDAAILRFVSVGSGFAPPE